MNIFMSDWRESGKLFEKNNLPYTHGQELEGTMEDVLSIVKECLSKNLNVMVVALFDGKGTRKSPHIHAGWMVSVDTYHFQQR